MPLIHALAAWLPKDLQHVLRQFHFRYLINRASFLPDELEIADVETYARPGDWVIDVGANVGRYTCFMSRCVGEHGRVLAFEPILESFSLLTANVRSCRATNVSLYNLALSNENAVARMAVPAYPQTHLNNYYEAHIAPDGVPVLCLTLDSLPLAHAVRLIKIDAEGHDLQVLQGAHGLIARDRPVIIVEGWESGEVAAWLRAMRYAIQKRPGSHNMVALPGERPAPAQ